MQYIYHIAPVHSVAGEISADCGYILISTERGLEDLARLDNVLVLDFADTEDEERSEGFGRRDAIQPADVRRMIAFLKGRDWKEVFIACDAGESRSPAVVAGLLRISGRDDSYIWTSTDYRPNVRVYRTILECFRGQPGIEDELKRIENRTAEEYRQLRKSQKQTG